MENRRAVTRMRVSSRGKLFSQTYYVKTPGGVAPTPILSEAQQQLSRLTTAINATEACREAYERKTEKQLEALNTQKARILNKLDLNTVEKLAADSEGRKLVCENLDASPHHLSLLQEYANVTHPSVYLVRPEPYHGVPRSVYPVLGVILDKDGNAEGVKAAFRASSIYPGGRRNSLGDEYVEVSISNYWTASTYYIVRQGTTNVYIVQKSLHGQSAHEGTLEQCVEYLEAQDS